MNNHTAFAKAPNERTQIRSSPICAVVQRLDHDTGDDLVQFVSLLFVSDFSDDI